MSAAWSCLADARAWECLGGLLMSTMDKHQPHPPEDDQALSPEPAVDPVDRSQEEQLQLAAALMKC